VYISGHPLAVLRFKMNALVLAFTTRLGFLGKRQKPMPDFRLLRAGLDVAQSIRAWAKVIAMGHNKRGQLQCGTVGVNLEQFKRVGWSGG